MARFEFIVYSAIQGYHEYKGESNNWRRINSIIVGHVSRKIATSCNAFIRHGGTIECTVTGNRRYSVEGGLELPCKLRFVISSSQEFCKKTETSICAALSTIMTFSLDKSTSVVEDEAMVVEIKMEDSSKPNHSGYESPPSFFLVAMDDDERCHAVCEDSHTNENSTKSVVHNNIAVEEVVCSQIDEEWERD